jgi:hypothetical protein
MERTCDICARPRAAGSDYCSHHLEAYRNLMEVHRVWREALDIDWAGFLREICAQPETGIWAREVAESLMDSSRSG